MSKNDMKVLKESMMKQLPLSEKEFDQHFGRIIKDALNDININQKNVAHKINISEDRISRIIIGNSHCKVYDLYLFRLFFGSSFSAFDMFCDSLENE